MDFKRVAPNKSFSECGLYRIRKLRDGLFIAERHWNPGEKPRHLYAPWAWVAFSDTERGARDCCRAHFKKQRGRDARNILRALGLPTSGHPAGYGLCQTLKSTVLKATADRKAN